MGTKIKDFIEDPREKILGNQGFQAREASYPCYYDPRGRDSSYFGLFSALRAIWLCFFSLSYVWVKKKIHFL